jgi:hypothetical protein
VASEAPSLVQVPPLHVEFLIMSNGASYAIKVAFESSKINVLDGSCDSVGKARFPRDDEGESLFVID